MKIYQIDSSARKKGSTSRALAKKLLDKIKKPEDEVVYRDLDDEMLFVSGLTESGMKIPENERTQQHKKMFELSDKLVLELKESDVIIISVPIYNFGPPATLKAWSDLAARVKETFKYNEDGSRVGLLQDKKVYLVITSGGTKINSKEDFLTPWLIHVLNFFGIKNINIIAAAIILIFFIPKKFKTCINHGVKKSSLLFIFVPPEVMTKYTFLSCNKPTLLPSSLYLNVSLTLAAKSDHAFNVAGGPKL